MRVKKKISNTLDINSDGVFGELYQTHNKITPNIFQEHLRRINLIKKDESLISYQDNTLWERGGAEMYIAVGTVTVTDKSEVIKQRKFIAKSLVSLGSRQQKFQDMLYRRKILKYYGINTPELYHQADCTLYEAFIERELKYKESDRIILIDLGRTAAILDYLGYTPLGFMHDMRVNESNQLQLKGVYYIDFGFDLGEQTLRKTDVAYQQLMHRYKDDVETLSILNKAYLEQYQKNQYKANKLSLTFFNKKDLSMLYSTLSNSTIYINHQNQK